MPHKLNYSPALEKAKMDAIPGAVGSNALLYLYSGTQPSATTGADGTLVAGPFTISGAFATAGSATLALPSVLSPSLPADVTASASVQPTWWRVKTSGGVAIIDGSAGTDSTFDMTVGVPTSGLPVHIQSWTLSSATFGH